MAPSAMECLLHYFTEISREMPQGNIIVHRQVLKNEHDWNSSEKKIGEKSIVASAIGGIENSQAELHADFANQYIGGGALHGGNVQEEILFLIKPECLVTLLFCAKMEDTEVIFITGAQRFSDYYGYGGSFRYGGPHKDQTPRDESTNALRRTIVAMDASVSSGKSQFFNFSFKRDLNKAYCAFMAPGQQNPGTIATGNW